MKRVWYVPTIAVSVLFLSLLLCVQEGRVAFAQEKADEHKLAVVDYKSLNPPVLKLRLALDATIAFDFLDCPLRDVMEEVQERHGINIHIDRTALRGEGIGTDEPITLQVDGITFRSALRLLLRDLNLTYVIENEVLLITTQSVAEDVVETRVYELRYFPAIDPKQLALAIKATIRPGTDAWNRGAVHALPTCLIITQSRRVHEEIAGLMRLLIRHTENPVWK